MSTTHSIPMGDRGRVVIPADMRARLKWDQGTSLLLIETENGVVMATREQVRSLVRGQLSGPSLVDDLIASRRAEAERETTGEPRR